VTTPLKLSAIALLLLSSFNTRALAGPASQPTVVEVNDRTKVYLLGVSSYPPDNDSWFAFNGEPIEMPDQRVIVNNIMAQPQPEHEVAFRLEKPRETAVRIMIDGATVCANSIRNDDTGETILVSAFSLANAAKTAKVEIGFADSEWKTVAASERPAEATQVDAGADVGAVTIQPIEAEDSGSKVVFEHAQIRDPHRYVALDAADKEYEAHKVAVRSDGQTVSTTCTFEVAPEKVKKVLFQTRTFTKVLDVSDISLEKGHATQPKIEVRDAKDARELKR
jgi:hypothetical protein